MSLRRTCPHSSSVSLKLTETNAAQQCSDEGEKETHLVPREVTDFVIMRELEVGDPLEPVLRILHKGLLLGGTGTLLRSVCSKKTKEAVTNSYSARRTLKQKEGMVLSRGIHGRTRLAHERDRLLRAC